MLDDLSSIDLNLLEDIGLVGLRLDLNGLVDHLAELSVALIKLTVSLHEGFISWSIGLVLIFELKDSALEIGDLLGVLLLILRELFVGSCEFVIYSVAFLQSPVGFLQFFL